MSANISPIEPAALKVLSRGDFTISEMSLPWPAHSVRRALQRLVDDGAIKGTWERIERGNRLLRYSLIKPYEMPQMKCGIPFKRKFYKPTGTHLGAHRSQ